MSPPNALPARPSLSHLKHQAEDLRRAFASGDAAALARVAAVPPLRDRDPAPGSGLSASHALLVIAREYGFASWPALTQAIKEAPMTTPLKLFSLDELGMDAPDQATVRTAIAASRGLMLMVGPRGNGKTNTLYSVMREAATGRKNPVALNAADEPIIPGVRQIKVDPAAGRTLAAGLQEARHASPEVMLVDMVETFEEVEVTVQAAASGPLVLAALHVLEAAGTIPHLRAMHQPATGAPLDPALLAGTITLVIGQRLLRKVCPECRSQAAPTAADFDRAGVEAKEFAGATLVRGKGCDACGRSGYKGRTALYEILVVSPALRTLIERNGTVEQIRTTAIAEGMRPLRRSAIEKIRAGIISLEQIAGAV